MKKYVKPALLILLSGVFILSGYQVISTIGEYHQAENLYKSLQQEFVKPAVPTAVTDAAGDSDEKPKSTAPIQVDFPELLSRNRDVVGWLYCPDTVVNYPVVQAADNETYLHTDLYGDYLRSGTLFADCNNEKPMVEKNYIVHGHSMKDGSMFDVLLDYKRQSFYDRHPVWYYLTPEENYRIELVVGCVVYSTRDIYTPSVNAEVMMRELGVLEDMSTFQSATTYSEEDCFVTFSTCSYEFDTARYVLVGKLVPME